VSTPDTDGRQRRRRALLAAAAGGAVLLGIAAVAVRTTTPEPHSAPRPAPNFNLFELGHPGKRVALAAYAGRPVIINFFASWCPPCRRETPLLASFYRAHHGQVLMIGVDSGDESAAALRFVASNQVTYPVGVDAYPAPASTSYGIIGLPQTFMLNARHQIVKHISGDITQGELDAWASSLAGAGRH
jgi:cytochrome c biogenesis protein CcmG/thiol:disulfide interchange protein DsbE